MPIIAQTLITDGVLLLGILSLKSLRVKTAEMRNNESETGPP